MSDVYTPPKSDLQDKYGSLRGQISVGVLEQLRRSKSWVRLISVVGIIFSALSLIPGVGMILASTSDNAQMAMAMTGSAMPSGVFIGLGIFYLVVSVLALTAFIKLFSYASAINKAVNAADAAEVESALKKLAGFWKYAGILTLLWIIIMVFFFVAMVGMATMFSQGFRI